MVALITSRDPSSPLRDWVWVVFGAFLLARVAPPIYTWYSRRFDVASDGVWLSTGLLIRRTHFTPRSSITVAQVDVPWSYRIFGLSCVTLLQGGDEAPQISLPGVDKQTTDRLVRLAEGSATVAPRPFGHTAKPASTLIYRSTSRDLLLASLIYGRFATLGAAAGLAVLDGLDTLGLTEAASGIIDFGPLIVGSVLVLGLMAVGAVATLMRFAGLETSRAADGVVLRYGAFSTRERVVPINAIAGIELRRSLLEIALGRVRLSLITTDSATRLGSNLVLPSLREEVAADIVSTSFSADVAHNADWSSRGWRPFATALLALTGTLIAASVISLLLTVAFSLRVPLAIAVFAVIIVALGWLGSAASARLHVSRGGALVAWSSRYISVRQRILDPASIHVLATRSVKGRPMLVRVHYYAGMPRALRATHFEDAQVRELAGSIGGMRMTEGASP